jgi:quercetin dioxygenase-like cupin family protein
MAEELRGLVLPAGEGHVVRLGNSTFTFKAVSEDTGGAYSVMEYIAPPGAGSPMHRHHREDEAFHILEGTMTFRLGEKKVEAGAGAFVYIPRGLRHAFANQTEQPVRALVILTPAGLERYFQEVAALAEAGVTDASAYQTVNEKYGLEFETG